MTTTTTTTGRYSNRAPKGGAVSPVNGRWYAGGQWMPMGEAPAPAPKLAGSSRQVLWAARLRREALARLEDEIQARRLDLDSADRTHHAGDRRALRRLLAERHALATERRAEAIIARRAEFAA